MLIIAPEQWGKKDIFSIFLNMKVYCVFSFEYPHQGDSNEYTRNTIFDIEIENHPKLSKICGYEIFFYETQDGVRHSRGKRAISVRATEVYCITVLNQTFGVPK